MSEPLRASAEIIPFPRRRLAPQDSGQERLQRALAALEQALTQQREAVAGWRAAIIGSGTAVSGLGGSLRRYRGTLDALGARVDHVHAQAVQLEQIADTALIAPAGEWRLSRDCRR